MMTAEKPLKLSGNLARFDAQHPGIIPALVKLAAWNDFAKSVGGQIRKYGRISEKQMTAVKALIAKTEAREAADAVGDLDPLHDLFDVARASGIKRPRLKIDGFVLKPPGQRSRNPDAVYIYERERYCGKVDSGRFTPAREGIITDPRPMLKRLAADPLNTAVAHGRRTGECACCGRELTCSKSIARGVGPVCAERWGL